MSEWDTSDGWFVYACSENDGLETLVRADDIESANEFENRECETLTHIEYWNDGNN